MGLFLTGRGRNYGLVKAQPGQQGTAAPSGTSLAESHQVTAGLGLSQIAVNPTEKTSNLRKEIEVSQTDTAWKP